MTTERERIEQLAKAMKGEDDPGARWQLSDVSTVWTSTEKPHSWIVLPMPPMRSICINGTWYRWPLRSGRLVRALVLWHRICNWLQSGSNQRNQP